MMASLRRPAAAAGLTCALVSLASIATAAPKGAATPASPIDASAAAPESTPPQAPAVHYPEGELHSPMTREIVDNLRAVLDRSDGRRNVFAKIGDSNTVNASFMGCFAGKDVRLGAHAALASTLAFFGAQRADEQRTSYDRITEAATVGWLAGNVLAGGTSPLARELAAVKPAFAVIMLGTNDNRPGGIEPFAKDLAEVVDRTLAAGVVPLLSTIPPRADSPAAAARVPEINAAIRAIAEARRVPLMDLHAALLPLRGYGLAADGVHLQMAGSGTPHGCWLTPDALQRGMNVRNLLTLTALDRARRFLIDGEPPEDAAPEPVAMNGR
jgi:hypothetical protein